MPKCCCSGGRRGRDERGRRHGRRHRNTYPPRYPPRSPHSGQSSPHRCTPGGEVVPGVGARPSGRAIGLPAPIGPVAAVLRSPAGAALTVPGHPEAPWMTSRFPTCSFLPAVCPPRRALVRARVRVRALMRVLGCRPTLTRTHPGCRRSASVNADSARHVRGAGPYVTSARPDGRRLRHAGTPVVKARLEHSHCTSTIRRSGSVVR